MLNQLQFNIKNWFRDNNLDTAIVGFSGGIDSAVTAALCATSDIKTLIIRANLKDQTLSSPITTIEFRDLFQDYMFYKEFNFELDKSLTDIEKEAALPIIRNSYFYAIAAGERAKNHNPCVVGTTNFDEASYLGFWGKASDGAQDFYPISHLHKSEVYELAHQLNIPNKIINAIPSGDLQFSGELNDFKMIGATYNDIENIAQICKNTPSIRRINKILEKIANLNNPNLFCNNIIKNSFKYKHRFPGDHLDDNLEEFRKIHYPSILESAKLYLLGTH